ncbi:MAG: hypothetical protein ACE5IC_10175 [Candidatus Brocadiales bacterium]
MDVAHPAGHFALGMGAAFLTACALLPFRAFRERLMPYSPAFIIGCGCWALIPDLPLALFSIPVIGKWMAWTWGLKATLHGPILGNIFFMHAYIDRVLDRTRVHQGFETLGVVAIVFMFCTIVGWCMVSYFRKRQVSRENP